MKKIIIILVIVFSTAGKVESQSMFNFLRLSFGLFRTVDEGGYEGRLTWYNNSLSTLHGIKGIWNLGERFNLGYTLHYGNNVISSLVNRQRYRMYIIETGIFLEYIFTKKEKWFLSIPVQFSLGSIYIPPTYVPVDEINSAGYFSCEPRIQINRPLLSWVQVSASVGYRFISASDLYGTNNSNLAGPSLGFSLVFGDFKK